MGNSILSSSEKIPFSKDKLKIFNRGILRGPKQFLITLKLIPS